MARQIENSLDRFVPGRASTATPLLAGGVSLLLLAVSFYSIASGAYMLAALVDEFWHDPTNAKLAAEIRLQRQCYGLTPIDRRRLQWEIERAEDAQDRGKRRRPAPQPSRQSDPRSVLHAV